MNLLPDKAIENRSITRRLTASLLVTVLIVSVIAVTAMNHLVSQDAIRGIEQKGDETLAYLVGTLEIPLWTLDYDGIKNMGRAIAHDESIVRLIIKNESGAVIYSMEKESSGNLIDRSAKIYHKQGHIENLAGEVSVSLTQTIFNASNRQLLFFSMLIIFLILISVAIVTVIFIRTSLNKPLKSLNEITNHFASGRYDTSGHTLPYLEFQPFGRALADMAEKMVGQIRMVQAAEKDIRKLNTELEQRVEQRTAELSIAKERAESANRAKSAFLSNMSHELRTPMNAVLGYSQLMQRDASLSPVQKEYLNTINRSGEHLLALIDEVLEISKIEARQITLKETVFDLHALLQDLKAMFRVRTDAKGLQWKVTGIDEVPRYIVFDENKLRQVLINLMGNAVKYTETGGITVRTAMEGMRLVVEVEDTGYGIADDELGKVFQYFEQTESGRKSKTGTGLGLAISREYARMMGGDITVASSVNKGSIFRFEAAVIVGKESDIKEKLKPRRAAIGLEPAQGILRILVAEDAEESRVLLTTFLTSAGFQVREAANGKEAVEIFEQWHPHLIWMDIRMPVMDGLLATRRIKETEAGRSTIVVALTAHALEEEKKEILSAGCDDFVRKPFREHDIFDVMAKHLHVGYVYEEEQTIPVETAIALQPGQLAALPHELLNRLRQAVVELDTARTLEMIGRIAEHDTSIGNVLYMRAGKLDYRGLLDLLEQAGAKGGETL